MRPTIWTSILLVLSALSTGLTVWLLNRFEIEPPAVIVLLLAVATFCVAYLIVGRGARWLEKRNTDTREKEWTRIVH